jgi:uncharacterized membrane protein YphA (DoxX/SURF4 family)
MKKTVEIYSLIAGIIFLIAGIAKSLNVSTFADLIIQYGIDELQFLAPIIVLTEVFLGLLLIFNVRLKYAALISMSMTVIFTVIYMYGFVFNGIEDCGCFGEITVLNASFAFTFSRNIVLIYLLTVVWQKSENNWNMNKRLIGLVLSIMCIVAFISGYTYHNTNAKKITTNKYTVSTAEKTILKELIPVSEDSTYLIFAFTYFCPHCMNSIENLKQYKSSGVVDEVIGIALEDSIAERKFIEIFKPEFIIKSYSAKTLFRLTRSFPIAYYVRNDSVITKLSGELPCSYVFSQQIRRMQKQ